MAVMEKQALTGTKEMSVKSDPLCMYQGVIDWLISLFDSHILVATMFC
jgi:hypothetical protein